MCLTMLNSSLSTFFSRICYWISLMFSTFQTIFNTPFTTIQDCPLHLLSSVSEQASGSSGYDAESAPFGRNRHPGSHVK